MRSRLACLALVAIVGCKAKDGASAEPAGALPANSAAALAAAALAQAAASAASAAATAPAASVAPAAAVATPSAATSTQPAATAENGFSMQLANELGRLGFSTGSSDLLALGRDRGVLLAGLGRLAGHPSALSAVFNSDKVVSAFMKRADVQDFCRDPKRLGLVLSFALGSPAARAWVADPASLKALTGSKLGVQFQTCPAFKALAQQPRSLAELTRDSPGASAVVNNPHFRAELERLKIRQDAPAAGKFAKASLKPRR